VSKKPKILELEPRIMFDGAMADDFCDTAFGDNDSILNTVSLESEETFKDKKEPTEVVIVDTSVSNYQEIISSIDTDLNIVVLQQGSTLRDIPELLVEYSDIDALHIVSHGGVGTLQVGSQWYDQNNIYTDIFQIIKNICDS